MEKRHTDSAAQKSPEKKKMLWFGSFSLVQGLNLTGDPWKTFLMMSEVLCRRLWRLYIILFCLEVTCRDKKRTAFFSKTSALSDPPWHVRMSYLATMNPE
jgi:hypothetical protein